MIFGKTLIFIILHTASSYYFYNHGARSILTQYSLKNVPPGYILLPPPKNNRNNFGRGNRNGFCSDVGFKCSTPFSKSLTFQFECDQDYQCPKNYKCCPQNCFPHKICSKASFTAIGANSIRENSNLYRSENCEKWPYNCQKPYDYSVTSVFKCDNDRHCPRNYKCCQQNCFLHKVCSRVVTNIRNENIKIKGRKEEPKTIMELIARTTTEKADEYYDESEKDIVTDETNEEDYEITEVVETTEITTTPEIVESAEATEAIEVITLESENLSEELTESTLEWTTLLESSSNTENLETDEFSSEPNKNNFTTTVGSIYQENKTRFTLVIPTPDSNGIIPEYAEYYYHYDNSNSTAEYEDYDEHEEEDEGE